MTRCEYIHSCAELPFDLPPNDADADKLWAAVPEPLISALNAESDHETEVLAGDIIAAWMRDSWRNVLPELAARFPSQQ